MHCSLIRVPECWESHYFFAVLLVTTRGAPMTLEQHHSLFSDTQSNSSAQVCSREAFYLSYFSDLIIAINSAITFQPLMVNVVSALSNSQGESEVHRTPFNIRLNTTLITWENVSMLVHCLPVTHIAALFKCSCFLGRCCGLWLKLLLPRKRSNLASL